MGTIAIYSAEKDTSPAGAITVGTWQELVDANIDVSGFWISSTWRGNIDHLVDQIRSSALWEKLIFTEREIDNFLTDGTRLFKDARILIEKAQLAKHSLHIDSGSLIPAEKLLLYMYIRGEYKLMPKYVPQAKSLYVYPVAEILGPSENSLERINRLVRSQLLTAVNLVNRLRLCKECSGGHISFVDVCPSCTSIEINHTPSLHCFTCGHSSRKADFELEGALVCPKCQARLRHIGVDYDLPTAQYACRKCSTFSMEPKIVAHCLDCGTKVDPDQLDVQEIYTYVLNSRGMEALRQGQFHESFSPMNDDHHVIPAYFKQLLQWTATTQQRYKTMSFGLMLIEFTNISDLLPQVGAGKLYVMITEYTNRIRQILRNSDVTSIDSSERLWVLLPFTSPGEIVERLTGKAKEIQPSGNNRFEVRIRSVFVPRDISGNTDPDAFMHNLLQPDKP